jgi:hypothetical protein
MVRQNIAHCSPSDRIASQKTVLQTSILLLVLVLWFVKCQTHYNGYVAHTFSDFFVSVVIVL